MVFAVFFASFCSTSFAQVEMGEGFQEVTSSSVQILGKGLLNQETNEVLAYACVGPEKESACDDLQMIYFNPRDQKSYLFGHLVHLDAQSKKELRQFFKKLKKGYYGANPTFITRTSSKIRNWINKDTQKATAVVGAGGILVCMATMPALVAAGIAFELLFPASLAIVTATYIVVKLTSKIRVNPLSSATFESFHDTRGWNWSISSKKLSAKKFEKVFGYLRGVDFSNLP